MSKSAWSRLFNDIVTWRKGHYVIGSTDNWQEQRDKVFSESLTLQGNDTRKQTFPNDQYVIG